MIHIVIERVSLATLGKCNTNNHPREDAERDLDYNTEVCKTDVSYWADVVGYPIAWTYELTEKETRILKNLAERGRRCMSAALFVDDIEPLVQRLNNAWQHGNWFFRMDACSPKDGCGKYPVTNAQQVMEMLVTSHRVFTAISPTMTSRKLFFLPFFSDWDPGREFRVFCYEGRVTAVSQYSTWSAGSVLSTKSDAIVSHIIHAMVQWLETTILPRVLKATSLSSIVADVYYQDNDTEFRIVEFNPFGYWLPTGSALFHWLYDRTILYGGSDDGDCTISESERQVVVRLTLPIDE